MVSATTAAFPSRPANVTATPSAEGTITLTWADATRRDRLPHRTQRRNGTTGWAQVGTAAADATTYERPSLPENTRYYYRVIATNVALATRLPVPTVNAVSPGHSRQLHRRGRLGHADQFHLDRSLFRRIQLLHRAVVGRRERLVAGGDGRGGQRHQLHRDWPFDGSTTLLASGSVGIAQLHGQFVDLCDGVGDDAGIPLAPLSVTATPRPKGRSPSPGPTPRARPVTASNVSASMEPPAGRAGRHGGGRRHHLQRLQPLPRILATTTG